MYPSSTAMMVAGLILLSVVLSGCSSAPATHAGPGSATSGGSNKGGTPAKVTENAAPHGPLTSDPRSAPLPGRKPDLHGTVPIIMYHHIGDRKNAMFVKQAEFLDHLTRLEKDGFRPVTFTEYMAGCKSLGQGTSPVVMTFDDSNEDQLRLLPDGTLDPKCFLGIWEAFAKTHPDFPIRATFFVLPDSFFGQPKFLDKKLAMLKDWGCELANHSITHPILRKLSDDRVKREIGDADAWLAAHGAGSNQPFALPFGVSPRNKGLLEGFEYKGHMVKPAAILLVGSDPAPMPGDPKFNPLRVPRIQANHDPEGLDYWMDKIEKGTSHPYVAGPS